MRASVLSGQLQDLFQAASEETPKSVSGLSLYAQPAGPPASEKGKHQGNSGLALAAAWVRPQGCLGWVEQDLIAHDLESLSVRPNMPRHRTSNPCKHWM